MSFLSAASRINVPDKVGIGLSPVLQPERLLSSAPGLNCFLVSFSIAAVRSKSNLGQGAVRPDLIFRHTRLDRASRQRPV